MSNRDEFSEKTKQILRDRVGGRCSFPTCNSPTTGPSNESTVSVDATGMACHIFAAAAGRGAKRFDPDMSSETRKSADNGIWMCYTHGKQIDNDECRFTSDVLFKWKAIAEGCAQIENELRRPLNDADRRQLKSLGMAVQSVPVISVNREENKIIGEALRSSCADVIWGAKLVAYLRGYLIERTRNAMTHGGATFVTLNIEMNKVTLIDNGDVFSHHDLLASEKGKGGAKTKRELMNEFGHKIVSVTQRVDGLNHNTIALVDAIDDIALMTPCTVELGYDVVQNGGYNLELLESCSELYVTLPDFFSSSDFYWLREVLPAVGGDHRRLVFVINEVAPYIRVDIEESYPFARVIDLGRH